MPINKDFKRLVRRRMLKAGESHPSPRQQPPKIRPSKTHRATQRTTAIVDYAKLAGMSDTALKAKTGCTWERWVKALDRVEAHTWPHREIAKHVHDKYKIDSWWAQTVTVGYERIRGLREIGQRRGGGFEASKSRTFAVPVTALYRAFTIPRTRSRWLPGIELKVRKATPNKSVRITWADGTSVEVFLVSKGTEKSSATIQHGKLPTKESATQKKAYWAGPPDALGQLLAPKQVRDL